mmetsp:Transcript_40416/g.93645  ORF Transcript_40416/g.93645 Transcript_40416/m.93645 type:complete len:530 (+) Transcript_40416:1333-2922(+)
MAAGALVGLNVGGGMAGHLTNVLTLGWPRNSNLRTSSLLGSGRVFAAISGGWCTLAKGRTGAIAFGLLCGYTGLVGAIALYPPWRARTQAQATRVSGGYRAAIAALIGFGTKDEWEPDDLALEAKRSFKPLPLDAPALLELHHRLSAFPRTAHNADSTSVMQSPRLHASALPSVNESQLQSPSEEVSRVPSDRSLGVPVSGALGWGRGVLGTISRLALRSSSEPSGGGVVSTFVNLRRSLTPAKPVPKGLLLDSRIPGSGITGLLATPPRIPYSTSAPTSSSKIPKLVSSIALKKRRTSAATWLFAPPLMSKPNEGEEGWSDDMSPSFKKRLARSSNVTMPLQSAAGTAASRAGPPSPLRSPLYSSTSSPRAPKGAGLLQHAAAANNASLDSKLAWANGRAAVESVYAAAGSASNPAAASTAPPVMLPSTSFATTAAEKAALARGHGGAALLLGGAPQPAQLPTHAAQPQPQLSPGALGGAQLNYKSALAQGLQGAAQGGAQPAPPQLSRGPSGQPTTRVTPPTPRCIR